MVKYNKYSTKYNCLITYKRNTYFQIWFPNNLGLSFGYEYPYKDRFVCHALNFNGVSSAYLGYSSNTYNYGANKKSWEKYMERVRRVMDEAEL